MTLYSHRIHKNWKSDNSKYRWWYGAITILTCPLWECKLIQLLWNYLVTLKICVSCDPTIPFLSIYSFAQVCQEIYTRMSITTSVSNRMQVELPTFLSTAEREMDWSTAYNGKSRSNETKWISATYSYIISSDRSQTQKNAYTMHPSM